MRFLRRLLFSFTFMALLGSTAQPARASLFDPTYWTCLAFSLTPACIIPYGEWFQLNVCARLHYPVRNPICVIDRERLAANEGKSKQIEKNDEVDTNIKDITESTLAIFGGTTIEKPTLPDVSNGISKDITPDSLLTTESLCVPPIEQLRGTPELKKACGNDEKASGWLSCATQFSLSHLVYGGAGSNGRGVFQGDYSQEEVTQKDWCMKQAIREQQIKCAAFASAYLAHMPAYNARLKDVIAKVIENSAKPCKKSTDDLPDLPGCIRQDLLNTIPLRTELANIALKRQLLKSVCVESVQSLQGLSINRGGSPE